MKVISSRMREMRKGVDDCLGEDGDKAESAQRNGKAMERPDVASALGELAFSLCPYQRCQATTLGEGRHSYFRLVAHPSINYWASTPQRSAFLARTYAARQSFRLLVSVAARLLHSANENTEWSHKRAHHDTVLAPA